MKIGEGPYFCTQLGVSPPCSIGGVLVNRQMRACDVNRDVIPGLYVIGVDSFAFYTQMYYFQLSGSAVAFELRSGLVAAATICTFPVTLFLAVWEVVKWRSARKRKEQGGGEEGSPEKE